jgi:DNA-binding transcriptional LysR family regulator
LKRLVDMLETPSNVRDLLAFSVTMDLKSMTGAAKNLLESKGSISRRLSRLESQLGVQLIRRSARGAQPTELGETYHQLIKRVLAMLAEASAAVRPTGEPTGVLRISVSHGFGLQVLGPIIGRFAAAHRGLRLHVALSNSPRLDEDDVDVAIHPDRQLGNLSVASVKLINWEMRFVATPGYVAQNGPIDSLGELAHHPVLLGGIRGGIETSARRAGAPVERLVLEPMLTSDSASFVRQATLAGHGVGFIPSVIIDEEIAAGVLLNLFPEFVFPEYEGSMYLLSLSTQFVPAKVALFRDFMVTAIHQNTPHGVET